MVVIVVIVNGGSVGIERTVLMAVSSMVAAVDAGGNNCVFTPASNEDNHYPCPHHPCPCPCPPSDKDWTVG